MVSNPFSNQMFVLRWWLPCIPTRKSIIVLNPLCNFTNIHFTKIYHSSYLIIKCLLRTYLGKRGGEIAKSFVWIQKLVRRGHDVILSLIKALIYPRDVAFDIWRGEHKEITLLCKAKSGCQSSLLISDIRLCVRFDPHQVRSRSGLGRKSPMAREA